MSNINVGTYLATYQHHITQFCISLREHNDLLKRSSTVLCAFFLLFVKFMNVILQFTLQLFSYKVYDITTY